MVELVTSPTAAGGGCREGVVGAAVEKTKELCKAPEGFFGHRKRTRQNEADTFK